MLLRIGTYALDDKVRVEVLDICIGEAPRMVTTGSNTSVTTTARLTVPQAPRKLHSCSENVYVPDKMNNLAGMFDGGLASYVVVRKSLMGSTTKSAGPATLMKMTDHWRPPDPEEADISSLRGL